MFTFISNKNIQQKRNMRAAFVTVILTLTLSACNNNDKADVVDIPLPPASPAEYSYTVEVINLTNAQPLSPPAVILHEDNKMWMVGNAASSSLEALAEGGDNAQFIADSIVLASASGDGIILPGSSSTITIVTTDRNATYFTSAMMLVNTNDAFSGLTGIDISALAVNDKKSWHLSVFDAGTELNTESVGTIPGPADGGTGYDAIRDDVDFITYHSGVVSLDDGLSNSVLTQAHRFDNPAVKLIITRIK